MLVFQILLAALFTFVLLIALLYLIEPSLLAVVFTFFLKIFFKNPPILDLEKYFPEHKLLEENTDIIKKELKAILEHESSIPRFHEVDKIQTYISNKGEASWRVFVLKAYGNWVESNRQKAPQTSALVEKIPGITTAMFSILGPRKYIPPHIGLYKGIFRYHLGLVIPHSGPCYIIIGGEEYQWKEGAGVLFDDTYTHSVYNESDETRVVLFCDLYRNDLPPFFQKLNRIVYKLRERSNRLKKAVARAEVQQDLNA